MIKALMEKKYIIYDGGMGSMLIEAGMKPGERTDLMNIKAPEAVMKIHAGYVDAGSDIICTNTFSSCTATLQDTGHTADEVIGAAVKIAKEAADGRARVAVDIGPTGEFMEPYGNLTYERAYARFREQSVLGKKHGAVLAAIETMSALDEFTAAVNAVHESTALPIFASMTFNDTGKTYTGLSVEDFAKAVNDLPVAAAGINCSLSPREMYPIVCRLSPLLKKPMIVKLNAGLPDSVTGNYSVGPEEFARQMEPYRDFDNLKVVGGCCGTTPEHIKALAEVFR